METIVQLSEKLEELIKDQIDKGRLDPQSTKSIMIGFSDDWRSIQVWSSNDWEERFEPDEAKLIGAIDNQTWLMQLDSIKMNEENFKLINNLSEIDLEHCPALPLFIEDEFYRDNVKKFICDRVLTLKKCFQYLIENKSLGLFKNAVGIFGYKMVGKADFGIPMGIYHTMGGVDVYKGKEISGPMEIESSCWFRFTSEGIISLYTQDLIDENIQVKEFKYEDIKSFENVTRGSKTGIVCETKDGESFILKAGKTNGQYGQLTDAEIKMQILKNLKENVKTEDLIDNNEAVSEHPEFSQILSVAKNVEVKKTKSNPRNGFVQKWMNSENTTNVLDYKEQFYDCSKYENYDNLYLDNFGERWCAFRAGGFGKVMIEDDSFKFERISEEPKQVRSLGFWENFIFVVYGINVHIIDRDKPNDSNLVAEFELQTNIAAAGVFTNGQVLVVTSPYYVEFYDISEFSKPKFVKRFALPKEKRNETFSVVRNAIVHKDALYLVIETVGLVIYDMQDLDNITLKTVAAYDIGETFEMKILDNLMIIQNVKNFIFCDVSDELNPKFLNNYTVGKEGPDRHMKVLFEKLDDNYKCTFQLDKETYLCEMIVNSQAELKSNALILSYDDGFNMQLESLQTVIPKDDGFYYLTSGGVGKLNHLVYPKAKVPKDENRETLYKNFLSWFEAACEEYHNQNKEGKVGVVKFDVRANQISLELDGQVNLLNLTTFAASDGNGDILYPQFSKSLTWVDTYNDYKIDDSEEYKDMQTVAHLTLFREFCIQLMEDASKLENFKQISASGCYFTFYGFNVFALLGKVTSLEDENLSKAS